MLRKHYIGIYATIIIIISIGAIAVILPWWKTARISELDVLEMSNGDILRGVLKFDPIRLQTSYGLLLIPKHWIRHVSRHPDQANKSVLFTVTGEQLSGELIDDELAIFFDRDDLEKIQTDKLIKLHVGNQNRNRATKFPTVIALHSEDYFYAELTTSDFSVQATYGICTLNIQTVVRIDFEGDKEIIAKVELKEGAGNIHGLLEDTHINLMTEWGQTLTVHVSELASITILDGSQSSNEAKKSEVTQCSGENNCHQFNENFIVFNDPLKDGRSGPDVLVIPAGTYEIGSSVNEVGREVDEHQHSVLIERPFAMTRFEITFSEYDYFASATQRAKPDDKGWGRANRPVINVSAIDASAYAQWLSSQTGKKYRLPTEAEWEYAARAGTKTAYWWGNEIDFNMAVCDGCGSHWDKVSSAPVGIFLRNDFGLYDTLGNVSELTCSPYVQVYDGAEKRCAKSLSNDTAVAIRGGGWSDHPFRLRAAARKSLLANEGNEMVGFRLVREL